LANLHKENADKNEHIDTAILQIKQNVWNSTEKQVIAMQM